MKEQARIDTWLSSESRSRQCESAEDFDFVEDEAPVRREADSWPAFDDVGTEAAGVSEARVGTEAARLAPVPEPGSAPEDRVRQAGADAESAPVLRRAMGALIVLAAAAGAAFAIATRDSSVVSIEAPIAEAPPASDELACFGSFRRTFDSGMDVEQVDEGIWDLAHLYAAGGGHLGQVVVGAPESDAPAVATLGEAAGEYAADKTGALIAGASIHRAQAGDLRGLATAPCARPASDQYLVGSQTSVGTSNELVLVNIGDVPAVSYLEAYGSGGELSVSAARRIVVGVGKTNRVLLDGLVDSDAKVAFRVRTESGAVAATIQETGLDGARPAGTTFIPASAASASLAIPGIYIGADAVAAPIVRVANPGTEPATVSVRLSGAAGERDVEGLSGLQVGPQSVVDVPLAGIDAGVYGVLVDADAPVAAGVQLARQESEDAPRDIAWAAPVSATTAGVGVVGEATARLAVSARDGAARVRLVPVDAQGARLDAVELAVQAGTTAVAEVPAGAVALEMESDVPVHAGLGLEMPLEGGIASDWAGLTVPAEAAASRRITVR